MNIAAYRQNKVKLDIQVVHVNSTRVNSTLLTNIAAAKNDGWNELQKHTYKYKKAHNIT